MNVVKVARKRGKSIGKFHVTVELTEDEMNRHVTSKDDFTKYLITSMPIVPSEWTVATAADDCALTSTAA